jgi:hypothetical protein
MPSACGTPGNRPICATASDCPAALPVCRNMTCRPSADGGVAADSGLSDAAAGD